MGVGKPASKWLTKCLPSYLAVKHVFWGCLLVFHVPHECHTIWLVRGILVVVVGRYKQLRVLNRWKNTKSNDHEKTDRKLIQSKQRILHIFYSLKYIIIYQSSLQMNSTQNPKKNYPSESWSQFLCWMDSRFFKNNVPFPKSIFPRHAPPVGIIGHAHCGDTAEMAALRERFVLLKRPSETSYPLSEGEVILDLTMYKDACQPPFIAWDADRNESQARR